MSGPGILALGSGFGFFGPARRVGAKGCGAGLFAQIGERRSRSQRALTLARLSFAHLFFGEAKKSEAASKAETLHLT